MRGLVVALAVCSGACQPPPKSTPVVPNGVQVANFSLKDVNPDSPRTGQSVSPRDYDGRVTGWYFGHSS